MKISGFTPIVSSDPRVLILGSMPGRRSLDLGQYYGHCRNAFWPIMHDLGLCEIEDGYPVRLQALTQAGVALWDVLRKCDREGSLDADIKLGSEEVNRLDELLIEYPTIGAVAFNGAKAEALFRKHVLLALPDGRAASIARLRLPSTSPAHAIPYADKLQAWRRIVSFLEQRAAHDRADAWQMRSASLRAQLKPRGSSTSYRVQPAWAKASSPQQVPHPQGGSSCAEA